MSSTPSKPRPALTPRHQQALDAFVRFWGEMATHWGINRTMAQIHALLYASERPLDTDEIMARLDISRGNANMNLRALLDWSLISKSQQPGSRKDYYAAEKDVWTITTTIIEERRKQEILPVQEALARCSETLREGPPLSPDEAQFAARIDNLVGFLEVFEGFTRAFLPFLRSRSGDKVKRMIEFALRLRDRREPADA
ncbi:MAG: hypothetical protein R3181_03020 [Rubricoccaceae bacterium]|nr:hypothetical protein [Rubricoccaceae bacterium]